jgi:hypothetical protein
MAMPITFLRSASPAASTAEATLATVVEPPDTGASGMRESPSSNVTWSTGSLMASAATWVIAV